jgi:hypothetical protein
MSIFRFQMAISLDGVRGRPEPKRAGPARRSGMRLHEWVFELEAWRSQMGQEGGVVNASTPVVEEARTNIGAFVMGRNMLGGGRRRPRHAAEWRR